MEPGTKFGSWTVLGRGSSRGKHRLVAVVCACGTEKELQRSALLGGSSTSCGCQSSLRRSASMKKHGCAPGSFTKSTPEYNSWRAMRRRCLTPAAPGYEIYGGRGIKVCREWDSFEQFLADMGRRPDGMTLERLDVDGDYTPKNCVWATSKDQAFNRRTTKHKAICWRGETRSLVDWSGVVGISQSTLHRRLFVLSWSVDKALSTPIRVYQRHA